MCSINSIYINAGYIGLPKRPMAFGSLLSLANVPLSSKSSFQSHFCDFSKIFGDLSDYLTSIPTRISLDAVVEHIARCLVCGATTARLKGSLHLIAGPFLDISVYQCYEFTQICDETPYRPHR